LFQTNYQKSNARYLLLVLFENAGLVLYRTFEHHDNIVDLK